ncbi:MAG: hypothetical protein KDA05_05760 [Phycisphaerales bacterium]|nr:hypothetical protein [Phycisphaerales bacterium]
MSSVIASALACFFAAATTGAVQLPGEGGLLIVAPASLAPALEEFVAFKAERLPTTLVTLEAALAGGDAMGACADDAERLKRWLHARWGEGGVGYVLLVGDADVMPVRYMALDRRTEAAFNYAFYPTDLYYADLARADGSFDDWNARRDGFHAGYFGEVRGDQHKDDPINFDAVDYRPDVGLGRWPVSTPGQVAIVAGKTMAYERGVEEGRVPARAGMFMVSGWVDVRSRMDPWGASLPTGWRFDRFYDGGAVDGTDLPRPNEGAVVDLLREGVGLVVHAGHGSDDSWHNSLRTRSIARLDGQAVTPIVMSVGCSTARFSTLPPYDGYEDVLGVSHAGTNDGEVFDRPPPPPSCYARGPFNRTGLGERLLRDGPNGAVAYIGCVTGSQPCALTLAEGFVGAIGRGGGREAGSGADGGGESASIEPVRLGDCWRAAVTHYYDAEGLATIEPTPSWYPGSIFFQGMKFMLFGDPSVPLPGVVADAAP